MIRSSIVTGLVGGLIASLLLTLPVFYWFIEANLPPTPPTNPMPAQTPTLSEFGARPPVLSLPNFASTPTPADPRDDGTPPDGPRAGEPSTAQLLAYMLMSGLASVLLFALPYFAVMRARPCSWQQCAQSGALAGLTATLVMFMLVVFPAKALQVAVASYGHHSLFDLQDLQVRIEIADYILRQMTMIAYTLLFESAIGAMIFGGTIGAAVGVFVKRRHPEFFTNSDMHGGIAWERLDLIALMNDRALQRRTWKKDQGAFLAGLASGLVYGSALGFFAYFGLISGPSTTIYQKLGMVPDYITSFSTLINDNTVIPLFLLVITTMGGLPVLLLKYPISRLGARIQAGAFAGLTTAVCTYVGAAGPIYWLLLASPQIVEDITKAVPVTSEFLLTRETLSILAVIIYSGPFAVLAALGIAFTVWATLQSIGYGLILPMFMKRPVDRAAQLNERLIREATGPLPLLYQLAATDGDALEIMTHLMWRTRKRHPDYARLIASYHLLATQPEQGERALQSISSVLDLHPEWRWQKEVHTLHNILLASLQARSMSHILAIEPAEPPETESLPVALVRTSQTISEGLRQLRKLGKVSDLQAKLIFLNNALEELHRAEQSTLVLPRRDGPLLPERSALNRSLSNFQSIILSAIRDLQGRARIVADLTTRQLPYSTRLDLQLTLANKGLNIAENIRVLVSSGEGYTLSAGGDQRIELLPPGEERRLDLVLTLPQRGTNGASATLPRLRLTWRIVYDDAVEDDKELNFADVIEFIEEQRVFQRIFPIPYVTGTPLQTDHLFVGREDIFSFVQEHLLGAYQHNVIVLHGQRRTGKTSILYRLREVLASTHIAVLIDMQGKAARGIADFLYAIADDIAYALEAHGIMVELPPRQEFNESPEFYFKARFLRSVYTHLDTRNILLMFDEFEELQKRVEDGKLDSDVFAFLRNLMQHETRLNFIFAGTHKLEELAADYWSILFNIAAYKKITFLTLREVRRLMTEPVAPYSLDYDPLAVERVTQVTAGHPYFTQVVCHELVAYHNESQQSYLTISDIDQVLERITERGEAHFKYIWAEANTVQHQILLALAHWLEHSPSVTPSEIQRKAEKLGYSVSDSDIALALRELEARDIVARVAATGEMGTPDRYLFKIDLIRRWIIRARPAI